ncbi:MFS transporter [Stenoxybacter acetivorans]|uniref:MFS transporter n=1 Tax=Stenoxybacter acetivorans TaxID=422441 RepID=UPI0005694291|nr:MFS transporter [Stenoxybacter acetivorans]
MYLYILTSALYRLSCGALIIAVNWLMVISSSSLGWLATTVALTFIPAMVVPLIWRGSNGNLSGKTLTQYSLLAAAVISVIMFMTDSQYFLLGLNTVIWFFFFVMESSWESWFASECKNLNDKEIERFSSITMTANQAALMIGPVVVAYIFENQPEYVILSCAVLYLFCFIALWFAGSDKPVLSNHSTGEAEPSDKLQHLKISGVEAALLLIWPTLAMFNFMLPAQVVAAHGSMTQVGLLDALMGVGMIVSGFVVAHAGLNRIIVKYQLTSVLIIIAMLLWGLGGNIVCWLLAVFLLGVSFNSQRIIVRGELAKKYHPNLVGKIVSGANAFSFILISFSLMVFHGKINVNWIIPFVFSLLMGVIIPLKGKSENSAERSR